MHASPCLCERAWLKRVMGADFEESEPATRFDGCNPGLKDIMNRKRMSLLVDSVETLQTRVAVWRGELCPLYNLMLEQVRGGLPRRAVISKKEFDQVSDRCDGLPAYHQRLGAARIWLLSFPHSKRTAQHRDRLPALMDCWPDSRSVHQFQP
jgi:hypothetical protein